MPPCVITAVWHAEMVAAAFSADAMVDGVIAGYEQAIRRVPALSRALLAHA